MIRFSDGDLLAEPAHALVNPVNCVGVMGRGLAASFKAAYPGNFAAYANACRSEMVRPGRMFLTRNPDLDGLPRFIVNFPTKRHWRDRSRLEDITAGLVDLVAVTRAKRLESLAVPALGCGLGGLPWPTVQAQIEAAFADLPHVDVVVFPPR